MNLVKLKITLLILLLNSSAYACPPRFLCQPAATISKALGLNLLQLRFTSYLCDKDNPIECKKFSTLLERDWKKRFPYKGKYPSNPWSKAPYFYFKNGISVKASEYSCKLLSSPFTCAPIAIYHFQKKNVAEYREIFQRTCNKNPDEPFPCLSWLLSYRDQNKKFAVGESDQESFDLATKSVSSLCSKGDKRSCQLLKLALKKVHNAKPIVSTLEAACQDRGSCKICDAYIRAFKKSHRPDWRKEMRDQEKGSILSYSCERECKKSCEVLKSLSPNSIK